MGWQYRSSIGIVILQVIAMVFCLDAFGQPKGNLFIDSDPHRAEIFLNGTPYGRTPGNFTIPAGTYMLELKRRGYNRHLETIVIEPYESERVFIDFLAQYGSGRLRVKSAPDGATILIDGQFYGTTPATLILKSGRHNLRLEKKDYSAYQDEIVIKRDHTLRLRANLDRQSRYGFLIVDSDPPGARVYLRNNYYDLTPARIELWGGGSTLYGSKRMGIRPLGVTWRFCGGRNPG